MVTQRKKLFMVTQRDWQQCKTKDKLFVTNSKLTWLLFYSSQ